MSPGRWVCTAVLRGERKCQQPPGLEPGPSPTCHREEESPDAQRAPVVCTTSTWDLSCTEPAQLDNHSSARSSGEPPLPQPCVLLCWGHEEPQLGWSAVLSGELDVPPCLWQHRTGTASGGQGLPRGLHPPLLCGGCGAEEPLVTHSSFFSFPFGSVVGPILHQALSPHGTTPCAHLSAPPQPALAAKAAPAAPKPSPTENTGSKASGQNHCPMRAASHTGYRHPLSPVTHPPSRKQPQRLLEAHFSGSRQTLLLLPTFLARQRHRAHSQCCHSWGHIHVSPFTAVSGFSLHFGALPQTARAESSQVLGRGRGGKDATCSPWAESWQVAIPFIPEGAAHGTQS